MEKYIICLILQRGVKLYQQLNNLEPTSNHLHYVLYEPNHQIIIVEEFTLTKQGVMYNHKHKPGVE